MNASPHTPLALTSRIARIFLLLLLCIAALPVQAQLNTGQANRLGDKSHAWKPLNGLYLVLDQSVDIADLREAGREEIVLVNNYKFLEEKGDDPPVYMVLRREPDVPLVLKESPVAGKDDRDKPMLQLNLADEHVETLRRFTEEHLDQTVAIVIAGEVVSANKIKAVITGGKIQITRCDDNACGYLFLELNKSVEQGSSGE